MGKKIVFDFGDVIVDFDSERIVSSFCESEDDIKLLNKVVFENWAVLDTGFVTIEEYYQKISLSIPERLKEITLQILNNWYQKIDYHDGMFELIKELKLKGNSLYLISNAPKALSINRDKISVFQYFDGLVFSADIKMVKPNQTIFSFFFKEYSLIPSECIFIDDREENICASQKAGMCSYQFDGNTENLKDFLADKGVI